MSQFNDMFEILKNYEELKKSYKSKPILSKYEKTQLLGVRAEQIRNGAKPLIQVQKHITDELDIAKEELKQRRTPFLIKRKIGNNFEYWKIEDLS